MFLFLCFFFKWAAGFTFIDSLIEMKNQFYKLWLPPMKRNISTTTKKRNKINFEAWSEDINCWKFDKIPWYVQNFYSQPSPAYRGQIFLFIHSTACLHLSVLGRWKTNNLRLLKMINHFYTIPYFSISASDRIGSDKHFSKLKVSNDFIVLLFVRSKRNHSFINMNEGTKKKFGDFHRSFGVNWSQLEA